MAVTACETQFAPAERLPDDEVLRQRRLLDGIPCLDTLLAGMPAFVLILNRNRQILFPSKPVLSHLGLSDESLVRGLRPGEAFDCIHSRETAGGCGTTYFCGMCGAVRAILATHERKSDVQECRITLKSLDALDLRVWATPLEVGGELFTLFAATDISHEKRRQALERIFFHDVSNTMQIVGGLAELVCLKNRTPDTAGWCEELCRVTQRLTGEVRAQHDLVRAESSELRVAPGEIRSLTFLKDVVMQFAGTARDATWHITIDDGGCDAVITTDPVLLARVITNMLKNAAEAAQEGETITAGCRMEGPRLCFWVRNAAVMPGDVQLQVFQRSFSTKGRGRGLGTYSMRLITERYLKGSVSFVSDEHQGTTFRVCCPLTLEQP